MAGQGADGAIAVLGGSLSLDSITFENSSATNGAIGSDGVGAGGGAAGAGGKGGAFGGPGTPFPYRSGQVGLDGQPGASGGAGTLGQRGAYVLTDLGLLPIGGATEAYAINKSGDVVGVGGRLASFTTTPERDDAFLYSDGSMQDLGTLPDDIYSYAKSINDSGQIVGYSGNSNGDANGDAAFLYSGGVMQNLGSLGGESSQASGINNSGQVVGYSDLASGDEHAFLYSNQKMQDLGTLPGGSFSQATGINNNGQVAGFGDTADDVQAFLYSDGVMHDLGGTDSQALAINDRGQVVGDSEFGSGPPHSFLYSDGTIQDLGTLPGGSYSYALAINNNGAVVGLSDAGGSNGAFLYSDGSMENLNSLVSSSAGWSLEAATGINDSGQISGYGITSTGQRDAFLLTPTSGYLGFTSQPVGYVSATSLFNIAVTVDDATGATDTTYSGPVTLRLGASTGGGALDGTATVNAVNGVAVFNNLSITDAGTYTLVASAGGFPTSPPTEPMLVTSNTQSTQIPEVTRVQVDGSSWSAPFLSALETAHDGDGTGYAIPVGSTAQLNDLPWGNLDQIQIAFNEDVKVQEDSLSVTGLNVAQYTFANFSYNSTTHTATWTLASAIGTDKLSLDLMSTGPDAVTDTSGNPLDGEWTTAANNYPSGDGTAGW